jgi:hypothetical protein
VRRATGQAFFQGSQQLHSLVGDAGSCGSADDACLSCIVLWGREGCGLKRNILLIGRRGRRTLHKEQQTADLECEGTVFSRVADIAARNITGASKVCLAQVMSPCSSPAVVSSQLSVGQQSSSESYDLRPLTITISHPSYVRDTRD